MVVDANIVFAALVRGSKTTELLERTICFAPEYLFDEVNKYYSYLLKKSGCSKKEFDQSLTILKGRIVFVEVENYFFEKALSFSPDPKDVQYLAIALQLNLPLWSNDKKLKQQTVVRVYATHDLLQK